MLLVVGRIGRAHGVLGEATIEVRTDLPEERFAPGSVLTTDPVSHGPLTIRSGRVHNGTLLLTFEGITNRNAIEALKNTLLQAEVDIDSEGVDEDDFHVLQLIGCVVHTSSGNIIGIVDDVIALPGQDLLSVLSQAGDGAKKEHLIPFVRKIVPVVDIKNKKMIVDLPAGLLDDY